MKQQLEEQTKPFQPTVPKRKVASIITVKTTNPTSPKTEIVPSQPPVDEVKTIQEPLIKFEKFEADSPVIQPDLPQPSFIETEIEPIQFPKIEEPENHLDNVTAPIVPETNEEDEFVSPLVFHLLSMGFDKESVKKATQKHADLESAIIYLIEGEN